MWIFIEKKLNMKYFDFKQNEFEENHYIPSEVERIKSPLSSEIKELLLTVVSILCTDWGFQSCQRFENFQKKRIGNFFKKKFYELSKKYVFKAIEEATNDVLQKMIQKIKEEKKNLVLAGDSS